MSNVDDTKDTKDEKTTDDNPVLGFPKKFMKLLPDGFESTINSYSNEDIKKSLVEYERSTSEVEKDRDNDIKLTAAKDLVKDLAGGYRDCLKALQAKIKYLIFVLDDRGAA